jgi:uncharacterized damage-inducible protein DinB
MTKTIRMLALLFLVMTCNVATAQRQPSRVALDDWISTAEKALVEAADAMPEEKYAFAPTNGEFGGVRTFAEQLKHLAANNYGMSARIEGKTPAADQLDEVGPAAVKTKAQIIEYLKGSFAALHKAAASVDDANAVTVVKGQKHNPIWFVVDAVSHSFNHYGQIVEYLRMNGIVPPASR